MSFRIANHAVRMVVNNLSDVVKLTAVPFLAYSVASLVLSQAFTGTWNWGGNSFAGVNVDLTGNEVQTTELAMRDLLGVIINVIVYLPLAAWLAIGWHRFVLAEEYPTGFVPPWPKGRVVPYVTRVILLFAFYVLGFVALGLLVWGLALIVAPAGILVGFVLAIFLLVAFVRLSIVLPAISIDRSDIGFGSAWTETKGLGWRILGTILVLALYFLPILLIAALVVGVIPAIELPLTLLLEWLGLVITISLLTTLYGIAIEGRQLT